MKFNQQTKKQQKSDNLDLVRFKTKFELKILDPDYPSTYFPV